MVDVKDFKFTKDHLKDSMNKTIFDLSQLCKSDGVCDLREVIKRIEAWKSMLDDITPKEEVVAQICGKE